MKYSFYLVLLLFVVACESKGLKVDENKKPIAEVVTQEAVEVNNKYYFAFDSAKFTNEEKLKLNAFVSEIKGQQITITGNCDQRGTAAYNKKLGLKRAESVKKYLLSLFKTLKINGKKIVLKSNGKEKPFIPNAKTEAEHAQNRFALIEFK